MLCRASVANAVWSKKPYRIFLPPTFPPVSSSKTGYTLYYLSRFLALCSISIYAMCPIFCVVNGFKSGHQLHVNILKLRQFRDVFFSLSTHFATHFILICDNFVKYVIYYSCCSCLFTVDIMSIYSISIHRR